MVASYAGQMNVNDNERPCSVPSAPRFAGLMEGINAVWQFKCAFGNHLSTHNDGFAGLLAAECAKYRGDKAAESAPQHTRRRSRHCLDRTIWFCRVGWMPVQLSPKCDVSVVIVVNRRGVTMALLTSAQLPIPTPTSNLQRSTEDVAAAFSKLLGEWKNDTQLKSDSVAILMHPAH